MTLEAPPSSDLGLRRSQHVVASLIVVLVVGAVMSGIGLLRAIDDRHASEALGGADELVAVQELAIAVSRRASAARTYVRTGDSADEWYAERATLDHKVAALIARPRSEGDRIAFRAIEAKSAKVEAAIGRLVATSPGDLAAWDREVLPAHAALRDAVAERVAEQRAQFDADREAAADAAAHSRAQVVLLLCAAGLAVGLLAFLLIRVSRRLAKHRRDQQDAVIRSLLDQVPVGLWVIDQAGEPHYANRKARELLGIEGDAIVPTRIPVELGTGDPYPHHRKTSVRALAGERSEVNDLGLRSPNGDVVQLHSVGGPVYGPDGKLVYAVAAFQDARELHRMANTDALTGLVNRTAFNDLFRRERWIAERNRTPLALAVLDLDRFKVVNDTHGHAMGDQVLRGTAAALGTTLRRTDIVGRWGGEEMVALLPNTDADGGGLALDKALDAVRARSYRCTDGSDLKVTFSAGVVQVEPGETIESAVARADRLLYAAKHAGRDRVLVEHQFADGVTMSAPRRPSKLDLTS